MVKKEKKDSPPAEGKTLLTAVQVGRAIEELAREIAKEFKPISNDLVLVGIQTRGVPLAKRLAERLKPLLKTSVPIGALDITFFRDDVGSVDHQPIVKATDIPVDITGKDVVLVDDVFFTGRTIRSALDAMTDLGRPRRIRLACLVDRGHRELPIRPDYVGTAVRTELKQRVKLHLREIDGEDRVLLTP